MTTRFMDVVRPSHRVRLLGPQRALGAQQETVVKRDHVQRAIDQQDLSLQPDRGTGARDDRRRHHHGRYPWRRRRSGQRPFRLVHRRLCFGRPSRITATHRLGDGEVVDIEREVEMGGPIHSKGVLILAGYLGSKYAAERPLSLTARLVFEQSYSGVEGDSASSAELYALLSSLSGIPIQQRFAVTGSVNQRGQVQAIGGVNEKIEGYFDLCQALGPQGQRGSPDTQGQRSSPHAERRVRDAIAKGRFHIYPGLHHRRRHHPSHRGLPAGTLRAKGTYPKGSINRWSVNRLAALTEKAREAARGKAKTSTPANTHKKAPPAAAKTNAVPGLRAGTRSPGQASPAGLKARVRAPAGAYASSIRLHGAPDPSRPSSRSPARWR